jgi:hypothetical protein
LCIKAAAGFFLTNKPLDLLIRLLLPGPPMTSICSGRRHSVERPWAMDSANDCRQYYFGNPTLPRIGIIDYHSRFRTQHAGLATLHLVHIINYDLRYASIENSFVPQSYYRSTQNFRTLFQCFQKLPLLSLPKPNIFGRLKQFGGLLIRKFLLSSNQKETPIRRAPIQTEVAESHRELRRPCENAAVTRLIRTHAMIGTPH